MFLGNTKAPDFSDASMPTIKFLNKRNKKILRKSLCYYYITFHTIIQYQFDLKPVYVSDIQLQLHNAFFRLSAQM